MRISLPLLLICCLVLGACAGKSASPVAPSMSARTSDARSDQPAQPGVLVAANDAASQTTMDESGDQLYLDDGFDDGFDDPPRASINDPLEGWNRFWFRVNDGLYFGVLKPLAQGYKYVTPEPIRSGVRNMFHNVKAPVRIVNNILQGRLMAAGVEFSRFVANTAFGLLGFADVTKNRETVVDVPDDEDLGQTLAVWGADHGFYIVWPLLGPSSLRDSVGLVGDSFLDPLDYMLDTWPEGVAVKGGETINNLSFRLGEYEDLKEMAIEPYTAFRDAYIQNRAKRVNE